MNFDRAIKYKKKELQGLLAELNTAQKNTFEFLSKCKVAGIKRVSIGVNTKKIKSCKDWPFGYEGSCFADEQNKDWPAIWSVCSDGCGNSGQHSNDNSKLIDGVYELRSGKWHPVEP